MLQYHPVVGLDLLVVVDNAVQVYDQGDGKRAVLADDGHVKLNTHKGLNMEDTVPANAILDKINTWSRGLISIQNSILSNFAL